MDERRGEPSPCPFIAVVVAAGLSSRMGGFKPLVDVGGQPALFRLLDSIKASGIDRIFVVTGYERELIEDAILSYLSGSGLLNQKYRTPGSGPYDFLAHAPEAHDDAIRIDAVHNADFESGMFSSVRSGICRVADVPGTVALLFPADVPLVAAETIAGLTGAWEVLGQGGGSRARRRPFAVPACAGKNGHPLLIPPEYYAEILGGDGAGGLKGVRGRYDADMIRYETNDMGCVLDMDTPEDYQTLLEYYERKCDENAD